MKIKTMLAAFTMLVSSSAAFANAPMPFNLRAGHNAVYVDWKMSVLPTDSVDVSTPDGLKLGVVKALPGKTKQLTIPSDKNITEVIVDYKGTIHNVPLQHGMGSGSNR
ncbi:hypothetical protein NG896_18290 [Aeromonas veronii]|uniref:hypothetical protein n=1 Tax=Aeromonas veronii TaxID=654 RepID=UPI00209026C2|nr:hypothetical protein [Aeromonas veronii]MCO5344523.1 hypothetical protein [Aeromonas veronii]